MSMNADEESDEGTVPMKRPNKEGVASAEDVEGRTSPMGNGGESAAVRTPSRDTASIGLVAVRQAMPSFASVPLVSEQPTSVGGRVDLELKTVPVAVAPRLPQLRNLLLRKTHLIPRLGPRPSCRGLKRVIISLRRVRNKKIHINQYVKRSIVGFSGRCRGLYASLLGDKAARPTRLPPMRAGCCGY